MSDEEEIEFLNFIKEITPEPEPNLDLQSKQVPESMKVMFWYPQASRPELSINNGPFVLLPPNTNKKILNVEIKNGDIFPLTVVYRNEGRTFRKQTFEYYGGIDALAVSIQRVKE